MLLCFRRRGVHISLIRFNDFAGTNTMTVDLTGLQRRFHHICRYFKYINYRNHYLALVLDHLIPIYEWLREADASIMAIWKLMKYSSKSSTYSMIIDDYHMEHGEASKRLASSVEALIKVLDTIINHKSKPKIKGIQDKLVTGI